MNNERELTAERLRGLLSYDQATGVFTWREKPSPRIHAGAVAGTVMSHGYRHIKIGDRYYKAHRLAWLYVVGSWPQAHIDHRNCHRDDNRFDNLREASRAINSQNRRNASRGKRSCNLLGAYLDRNSGRWNSKLRVNGRVRFLGCFATAEEAHEAYVAAKRIHHPGCTI